MRCLDMYIYVVIDSSKRNPRPFRKYLLFTCRRHDFALYFPRRQSTLNQISLLRREEPCFLQGLLRIQIYISFHAYPISPHTYGNHYVSPAMLHMMILLQTLLFAVNTNAKFHFKLFSPKWEQR